MFELNSVELVINDNVFTAEYSSGEELAAPTGKEVGGVR